MTFLICRNNIFLPFKMLYFIQLISSTMWSKLSACLTFKKNTLVVFTNKLEFLLCYSCMLSSLFYLRCKLSYYDFVTHLPLSVKWPKTVHFFRNLNHSLNYCKNTLNDISCLCRHVFCSNTAHTQIYSIFINLNPVYF